VIQYCTKDGSQLIGKSLGNPINLYQALVSPDRKNRVIIWKCLGTIISGFQSDRDLSFSDIRSLTENTKAFTRDDSYQMAMESYLSTFKKYEIDKQEFLLWIEMLAEQLRTEKVEQKKVDSEGKSKNELVTVERSTRKIMKLIKENNFKILYDTYSRIPHEIERRITEAVHLEQQRTELKRQQEELKRQQDKDEEARRELQRKQAQEKLLLIRRGQLPQQRIKDLKLDLPRQPANSTDFEYICRDWLEAWGDFNVAVTPATGDGGIDVESHNCVAQAKFWVDNKVSRPDLQRLVGAASITGKIKVFFAYSSGYTNEAHEFAEHENVRMCLFAFNTRTQGFEPANFAGQWLIERLAEIHLPDPNHTVE
jgi:restriction endonuclease Mrr